MEREHQSAECEGEEEEVDSKEWGKVALLRTSLEKQDPDRAKEPDDYTLRRFLRARGLDVEKATTMFLKYLRWRRETVPGGFVSGGEVRRELARKNAFVQGFGKEGQPIAVVFPAKHCPGDRDMEEFKRFVIYILDMLCARIPSGQEKFICIGDLLGWRYYANCDIRAYIAALDIMQSYYPERLGKAFLIHVPYLFLKAWKLLCPFIDNNTKAKFIFVKDEDLQQTLLEDIDKSQLPEIYGGMLPLVASADEESNR